MIGFSLDRQERVSMKSRNRSKMGRNASCWCNSGLKYKRCHLAADEQNPFTVSHLKDLLNSRYSQKYCLHPHAGPHNCNGPIVRAHTIQRSGGLSRIASKQGFVYGFVAKGGDLAEYAESQRESFRLQSPKRIGVREASTFTGFCNKHDSATFLPIERNPFQDEPEHCFLLAYRAICRSLFMKRGNVEFFELLKQLDRTLPAAERLQRQSFHQANKVFSHDMLAMAEAIKKQYDVALINQDYSKVYYYVFRIRTIPEITCNGTITPHFDFQGQILQDPSKPYVSQEHITYSIIPTDGSGGAIVFSWVGESQVAKRLVQSLIGLATSQLPHAIVRFTFEHFENVFASPAWWDSLSRSDQELILTRSQAVVQQQGGLRDDGLRVVSWSFMSYRTNVA